MLLQREGPSPRRHCFSGRTLDQAASPWPHWRGRIIQTLSHVGFSSTLNFTQQLPNNWEPMQLPNNDITWPSLTVLITISKTISLPSHPWIKASWTVSQIFLQHGEYTIVIFPSPLKAAGLVGYNHSLLEPWWCFLSVFAVWGNCLILPNYAIIFDFDSGPGSISIPNSETIMDPDVSGSKL